ncbi:MAG: glycerol dehydrogenase [Pseudomonadota bacterium]
MIKIFGSPGRYIQGPGAIGQLGALLSQWGDNAVAILDPVADDLIGQQLTVLAKPNGIDLTRQRFGGECTADEIERQATLAGSTRPKAVCGVGGGKAIDVAKGVAVLLDLPLLILPTIASNDAPTSTLIVIYDAAHRVAELRRMRRSPDVVLVDTAIIARAPAAFLRAGIADGLSKTFEARQCALAGGANFFGGGSTETAQALADTCYHILRDDAEAALTAVAAQTPDDALERVVEAAVLLSGLGFENGGLSMTHGLLRGLTAEEPLAGKLHGELVAYALLVQLTLEGRGADFMADIRNFYRRIGLPMRLTDLGNINMTQALGLRVGEATLQAPYASNFERSLTPQDFADAMAMVEAAMEVAV